MAIQLTRQQYEEIYGQPPTAKLQSELDDSPTPVRMTKAEYNAKYRPEKLSYFDEVQESRTENREMLQETLQERGAEQQRIIERQEAGEISTPKAWFQRFGKGLSASGELAFEGVLGLIKTFTPQSVEQKTADFMRNYGEALSQRASADLDKLRNSDDEVERDIAAKADEFFYLYETDETFRTDVEAAGGVLEGMFSAFGVGPARGVGSKIRQSSSDAVKEAYDTVKSTADNAFRISDESIVNRRVEDLFDIENSYSTTRRAIDRSIDQGESSRRRIAATDVLVDAVDDNGVIRTTQRGGAVDQYKAVTVDGVEDVVRRILIKENRTVNVNEIADYLKTSVYASGLEGADLKKSINAIQRELEGLNLRADRFGNIPLSKVQDAKISATSNINYNVDTTPTIKFRKAKALGYKELLENKSKASFDVEGKKISIKEINKELAKYYEDIDRLRSYDGRRVKGGRLGKHFATLGGQVIGGVAGSAAGPAGSGLAAIAGGELASYLQARQMKGAMGRGTNKTPDKNPILERARLFPDEDIDLRKADDAVGVPQGLTQDATTRALERQIKNNVKQQRAAIKSGDFALVATLKEVYKSLVKRLEDYLEDIGENIGIGLSIRATVSPNSVAKKMDMLDVEEVRLFLENPQDALLDDKLQRLIEEIGLSKAELSTQVSFLEETLVEVDRLVESGKHNLIKKNQNSPDRNLNQSVANTTPNTIQNDAITDTVDDTGVNVNADNPQPATTKTTDLLEEARKYDSAEEFVRSQPVVYHGSPEPLEKFDNQKGGVYFTEDYYEATGFAGTPDNTYEGFLNFKKPLVVDAKGAKWDEINTPYGNSTQEVVSKAEKDGYDGIIFKNIIDNTFDDAEVGTPGNIYYAYKPEDAFLNESQLAEIWAKAN